ncbi:hypothetical protein CEXT_578291 [Caerostris extrusa]|uniref:Uncharacterized protein n=1 Tax=Caerostris extrusa TaxID=172846 RepID=A0AAV4VXQ6_CAEEX|nr:hypothetical protein CEXT_578291 [Caerostris extrusa]
MNSPTKRIFHNKFFAPLVRIIKNSNSSLAIIMPGVTSSHPVFRSTIPDKIFSVSNECLYAKDGYDKFVGWSVLLLGSNEFRSNLNNVESGVLDVTVLGRSSKHLKNNIIFFNDFVTIMIRRDTPVSDDT